MNQTQSSINPSVLWDNFNQIFKTKVKEKFDLEKVNDLKNTTDFYRDLIPSILKEVKTEHETNYRPEFYSKVDHTLEIKVNNWAIPVINVEVENNPDPNANYQEIVKFCYLNSHLKILFLRLDWNNAGAWDVIVNYYKDIIDAFTSTIGVTGIIGVYILDTTQEKPKYYIHKILENNQFNDDFKNESFQIVEL